MGFSDEDTPAYGINPLPLEVLKLLAEAAQAFHAAYNATQTETPLNGVAAPRSSSYTAVRAVLTEGLLPAQIHENWAARKRAAGWAYGPTKDVLLKTHPNLVRYAELSTEQQRKNTLFTFFIRHTYALLKCWHPALRTP